MALRPPAATLAAYVLWSATVRPLGFLTRETVLMSKHWMDKVWSWDHCFNALALANSHPELALDQFLVVVRPSSRDRCAAGLDHPLRGPLQLRQAPDPRVGVRTATPTPVRPDPEGSPGEVYHAARSLDPLLARSSPRAGSVLPFYEHGNDSGWDNSTVFDLDRLIESPDLAAFLILQLDQLASLAQEVDPQSEAAWRAESAALATALAEQLWDGRRCRARAVLGHRPSQLDESSDGPAHRCLAQTPRPSAPGAGREHRGAPHPLRACDRTRQLAAI